MPHTQAIAIDWAKVDKKKLALHLTHAAQEVAVGTDTPWDDTALLVIEQTISHEEPKVFLRSLSDSPPRDGKIGDFIKSPAGQLVLGFLKAWLFG